MPDPPPEAGHAEALHLIRKLSAARQVRIEARVQWSLEELGFDAEDVLSCLSALAVEDVHKKESDETVPGKWVYVFRTQYQGERLYVKVSICLPKDHDLKVLSFKRQQG